MLRRNARKCAANLVQQLPRGSGAQAVAAPKPSCADALRVDLYVPNGCEPENEGNLRPTNRAFRGERCAVFAALAVDMARPAEAAVTVVASRAAGAERGLMEELSCLSFVDAAEIGGVPELDGDGADEAVFRVHFGLLNRIRFERAEIAVIWPGVAYCLGIIAENYADLAVAIFGIQRSDTGR